ncbi:GMC family oxidoreductase [Larsenimonas rhizosphaerae]|uniref:GMC family oxidoreductase n=1 Tax=Larsenimonas rhizosphaerae TaxID=2944682 RepID=A0AA41ZHC8_9GAMM|nr:GMC family oxidoreductase [Larsenimonas rhizosphaerae]MCM2132098.1 GMC family oxidoreductase [Larsenimonas rhizosphaerae]MCX2524701.1 GMC family oxidoreductase [Larsenimonas rhizosphaerae]
MATQHKADVVIVGSGVAGGLVAHQMAMAGKSVLILEAGPRYPRGDIVERFRNQTDKMDFMKPYPSTPYAPHPEPSSGDYLIQKGEHPYDAQYIRAVGGTTWHWAASSWRFLPNDFKLKALYGVGRDWPIGYDELEPYYQRAEEELGVWGPSDEELGSPRSKPYPMSPLPLSYNEHTVKTRLNENGFYVVTEPVARNSRPYDERPTCCGNNNCMPICPIGAMYNGIFHVEKAERAGAKVIDKAVVYRIEAGEDRRIKAVHYKTPDGTSVRVEGKYFVIAANGIETPKLMLMSDVGNSSGMVGRNLMDHPGTGVSFFASENLWPGRGPQEMTSIVGWRDGDFRSEYAGKKLHHSNLSRTDQMTSRILKQDDRLILGNALDADIRDKAARYVQVDSFHELLPHPENFIRPSATEKDALGLPKPEFHYAIDDYVKRSAVHTREAYGRIAQLMGGTEVEYHDNFANNQHICGTVLMGDNPSNSVVDGDCRTHDHDNMFIASSGTMPTVGTVNCTLTIAALSLRIADTLKREV